MVIEQKAGAYPECKLNFFYKNFIGNFLKANEDFRGGF